MRVARILDAHGLRGEVKLRPMIENPALLVGMKAHLEGRAEARVLSAGGRASQGSVIARIEGIADRTEAERLKGAFLVADAEALPPPTGDEYYTHALIGLAVVTADGAPFGTVRAAHDFGAGDLLEIERESGGDSEYYVFTRATFPEVDVAARRLVIVPPEVV